MVVEHGYSEPFARSPVFARHLEFPAVLKRER